MPITHRTAKILIAPSTVQKRAVGLLLFIFRIADLEHAGQKLSAVLALLSAIGMPLYSLLSTSSASANWHTPNLRGALPRALPQYGRGCWTKTTSGYWQVTSYGNSMWLCECEDILRKQTPGTRAGREKDPFGMCRRKSMCVWWTDAIPEGAKNRPDCADW